MLPLDSPRWNDLQGTMGVTRSQIFIRDFLQFLDSKPTRQALALEYREFEANVYDDLFHQQCTWTAATAAIPYLLMIAKRLPTEERCHLLHACGVIVLEHFPAKENADLEVAYHAAISQARIDSIEFGVSTRLNEEQQLGLMIALAGFEGELYIYYALREKEWIEFQCASCEASLHAILPRGGDRFVVYQDGQFEFDFENGIAKGVGCSVIPATDIAALISSGNFKEYATLFDVANRGQHQEFLTWMAQVFGEFVCPACRQSGRISLDY